MPFVTEEIWSRLPHRDSDPELLMVARWPQPADAGVQPDARRADGVEQLIALVTAIRGARAESGIAAADWLEGRIWLPEGPARESYAELADALGRLARVRATLVASRLNLDEGQGPGLAVVAPYGEGRLLRSDSDRELERRRLEKEFHAAEAQLGSAQTRLSNADFTSRAPQSVVEQARQRESELREHVEALRGRLEEV
jgi:valyl-tRNA synthetase